MSVTLATSDPVLAAFAEEVGTSDPIAVAGARTRWDVGGALAADTRIVNAPTGIVAYRPEEMTVTVRAGTTVADLHGELAASGQRTALPERGGTVGGALAVGESDHRALGRGLVRTTLLQVRYVSAEGKLIASGGPTVKNVTGFDLPRLMVGSLGSLGLLAEVILRTNPIPAESRWLRADGVDPTAAYRAVLAPSAVLWDGTSTWVHLEGHGPDVDADTQSLAALGSLTPVDAPPGFPSHRWSLPPSELASFVERQPGTAIAAIGLGLAWADAPQPQREVEPGVARIAERLKTNFDPSGRLNPGRKPGHR